MAKKKAAAKKEQKTKNLSDWLSDDLEGVERYLSEENPPLRKRRKLYHEIIGHLQCAVNCAKELER